MAKKKAKQQNQPLSPEKYIKTKARILPIGKCMIRSEWQEYGGGEVVVPRMHPSGNITAGIYQVDLFCLGVRETMCVFNLEPHEYENFVSKMFPDNNYDVLSYEEAHNLIYGAIEYAEELGFKPEKMFALSQYILEEDTEDIPLIEFVFGKDDKPFLITNNRAEHDKYVSVLEKNVGIGNFDFLILDEEEEEEEEEEDMKDPASKHTIYDYFYPEYPRELSLTHPELKVLFRAEYFYSLPKGEINAILSLPHDSLINDLTHILLYETGKTVRDLIANDLPDEKEQHSAINHALFILGELKAECSLDTVLEVMRQNADFMDFIFGDSADMVLTLTLYYTGRNRLDKLMDYLKEPSLYSFFRTFVFDAVVIIARNEPERKDEIIQWFRQVLGLYIENVEDNKLYDLMLAGMLMASLIDLKAAELLPEIQALFNTGRVDLYCAGDYAAVEKRILSDDGFCLIDVELLNIYERYDCYEKKWNSTK